VAFCIGILAYVLHHYFMGWGGSVELPQALKVFAKTYRPHSVVMVDLVLFALPVIFVSSAIAYFVLRLFRGYRGLSFAMLSFGWLLLFLMVHSFSLGSGENLSKQWAQWPHVALIMLAPLIGFGATGVAFWYLARQGQKATSF
jgi:hypothetical protein